jgi:hypothetical protein
MSSILSLARTGRSKVRVAARRNEFAWRYMLNLLPTVEYTMAKPRLDGERLRVTDELNRNGIAITSAERLFGNAQAFGDLSQAVDELLAMRAGDIERTRAMALQNSRSGQKPFLMSMLGDHPRLDSASAYGRFALSPEITAVAQAYFGMRVALRYYNVWCNFVTREPARQSQLWHRDPEDRYILKVFVCMTEVNEGNGPFTYAPGTHPKGAVTQEPEFLHKDGKTPRSNDDQIHRLVPRDRWVRGVGPAGTVIFADTRGLHKGGLAQERDRLLYTAEFTSPNAGDGGIRTGRM